MAPPRLAVLLNAMRGPFLVALACSLAACQVPLLQTDDEPPPPRFPEDWTVVDLTRPLDAASPFVSRKKGYFPFERIDFEDPAFPGWRSGSFTVFEHMGTHVAAPLARFPVGATVDRIPGANLLLPLVVIDLPRTGGAEPDALVTLAVIDAHERAHGPIPSGSLVALRTGRGALAARDPLLTGGGDGKGGFSFPGWGEDAVRLLAVSRRVRAIGTDALAIDSGRNLAQAPAQTAGSAVGVWFLVALADMAELPPRGAMAVVGALPIVGGTGSPARVLALVPPARPPREP